MRYLLTPTLINAWNYYKGCPEEWENKALGDFLKTLNRESFEPTEAMKKGIAFEKAVQLESKDWVEYSGEDVYRICISDVAYIVRGGVWQAVVKDEITVDGIDFLLYGKVDVVKGPRAYDIKFTENYDTGKYFNSAQHHFYLHCLKNILEFEYLISDGRNTYSELYQKSDLPGIESIVLPFISELPEEYRKIYFEKWQAK